MRTVHHQILEELVTIRELLLVAIRFPDMTDEERQLVLRKVQERYRDGD